MRLSCCVLDARTRSAPSVRPLAPPRTRSGDQSRSSCLPALPGGPIDVMSEGAVGLDNARVAAWLAQERIRSDARSTNAQYRIPWAATGAGDGADPLQQALVDVQSHFLHVASQPQQPVVQPAVPQRSALPPSRPSASPPPRPSRKQRRANCMDERSAEYE